MTRYRDHDLLNSFEGVRAAITGGTSGLGLALVRELHRHGARVAFVARTPGRVAAVARDHPGAHGIVGDVSDKNDIYPMAIQITGELGGLDVLINNASDLGPTPLRMLSDTECEDLEHVFATNVFGPFRLTKALNGSVGSFCARGPWSSRAQHLERRGNQCIPGLGSIRFEQGGASSPESRLE